MEFFGNKTLMGILRFQVQIGTFFDRFGVTKGNNCFFVFMMNQRLCLANLPTAVGWPDFFRVDPLSSWS